VGGMLRAVTGRWGVRKSSRGNLLERRRGGTKILVRGNGGGWGWIHAGKKILIARTAGGGGGLTRSRKSKKFQKTSRKKGVIGKCVQKLSARTKNRQRPGGRSKKGQTILPTNKTTPLKKILSGRTNRGARKQTKDKTKSLYGWEVKRKKPPWRRGGKQVGKTKERKGCDLQTGGNPHSGKCGEKQKECKVNASINLPGEQQEKRGQKRGKRCNEKQKDTLGNLHRGGEKKRVVSRFFQRKKVTREEGSSTANSEIKKDRETKTGSKVCCFIKDHEGESEGGGEVGEEGQKK